MFGKVASGPNSAIAASGVPPAISSSPTPLIFAPPINFCQKRGASLHRPLRRLVSVSAQLKLWRPVVRQPLNQATVQSQARHRRRLRRCWSAPRSETDPCHLDSLTNKALRAGNVINSDRLSAVSLGRRRGTLYMYSVSVPRCFGDDGDAWLRSILPFIRCCV